MARVQIARAALDDLDDLATTLSLPADTRDRVRRSLEPLATLPMMGAELTGAWSGFRFILGPWRWFLIVYAVIDGGKRVVVVTMQDARSATAPTAAV